MNRLNMASRIGCRLRFLSITARKNNFADADSIMDKLQISKEKHRARVSKKALIEASEVSFNFQIKITVVLGYHCRIKAILFKY